jgi:GMP synthase (glutamine-hydrolysing)
MRKVLVFQHVAHKILGTLNPTLKENKLNIRYVNFDRSPEERPTLDRYNGLIVLGGRMGVYESDKYQHIKVEMQLIEEALKKEIPILGICLGAQLIANVLGANVQKHSVKEIGWYDINLTEQGISDPLFKHFNNSEKLFQLHGDSFEIPKSAIHLANSATCESQAFRYGENVYGLQFHLEVDEAMILRWLSYDSNLEDIKNSNGLFTVENIKEDTSKYLSRSIELSQNTFDSFVNMFNLGPRIIALGSDHSKPLKKSNIRKI